MELNTAYEKINMSSYFQFLLEDCYKNRHYHNIEHIKEMLKHVPDNYYELEILIEAILFHDIVQLPYPSASGLNEALSACEYMSYTSKYLAYDNPYAITKLPDDMEYERRVIEAIIATGNHLVDQTFLNNTSKFILDLDLSFLALPYDEYLIWSDKINKENNELYKEFPLEQIKQGRYNFLSNLLRRKHIYYIKTEWEDLARDNIKRELTTY